MGDGSAATVMVVGCWLLLVLGFGRMGFGGARPVSQSVAAMLEGGGAC
jgi:hypothetical protein